MSASLEGTAPLRKSAALIGFAWGAVVLVSQAVYVTALVPRLPAAYDLHIWPRPFGADNLWPKETLVTVGWAIALGIAAVAVIAGIAMLLGDDRGLTGALAVAVAAPVASALQLSNAFVALSDGPVILPAVLGLAALVLGIGSFFPIRRTTYPGGR